jgi:membrane-associated protein
MDWHQITIWFTDLKDQLPKLAADCGTWFYLVLFVVIFAETGLVVTPFLPGDSLLFIVGWLASSPSSNLNVGLLLILLSVAAVFGDAVNYAIGAWVGPKVFRYEKSRLFNVKHLRRAQEFYEKYGNKTIILARFVPIVRTFAPFVAGIGSMRYTRFFLYNVVGGVAWVSICLFSGWFFGDLPWVQRHFEAVVIAIVFISVLPMLIELYFGWRRSGSSASVAPDAPTPVPVGTAIED